MTTQECVVSRPRHALGLLRYRRVRAPRVGRSADAMGCILGVFCRPQLPDHHVHRPSAPASEQQTHERAGSSATPDQATQPQRWRGECGPEGLAS